MTLHIVFKNIFLVSVSFFPLLARPQTKQNPHSTQTPLPKLVVSGRVVPGGQTVYKYRLNNGMTVILLPDGRNPIIKFKFMLNAGNNREQFGKTGLAHFFEHMMFRKTKNHPEGYYDKVLSSVGGFGNAYTSKDIVAYESQFPSPAFEMILDLEKERFQNLDLSEPFFSIERNAVLSERRLNLESNAYARGFESLNRVINRDGIFWLTIGETKDIENLSISDAQNFYDTHYKPDNLILGIAGDFDKEKALKLIQEKFGAWKSSKHYPNPPLLQDKHITPRQSILQNMNKAFVCSEETSVNLFYFNFPLIEATDKNIAIFKLMSFLLNHSKEGDLSSRFNKSNLATDVNFNSQLDSKNTMTLLFSLTLAPHHSLIKTKNALFAELKSLSSRKWNAKDLTAFYRTIEYDYARMLETIDNQFNFAMNDEFYSNDFSKLSKVHKLINKVSSHDLKNFIKKYLKEEQAILEGIVSSEIPFVEPCSRFTLKNDQDTKIFYNNFENSNKSTNSHLSLENKSTQKVVK